MTRKAIHSNAAPKAIGPYSQAISAGGLVFCSGQIALDPATGAMVSEDDVRGQTEQVMLNLAAVLEAAGTTLSNVVKATIYVTSLGDFGVVNEIYGSFFKNMEPPARATVEVSALPKNAKVEIEVVALA
jgi:2-iminobutanoate/2-iminopropanoate deaminase